MLVSACLATTPLWAWGPHPEIVKAALARLPAGDRLYEVLGPEARPLSTYVWMGDWNNSLVSLPICRAEAHDDPEHGQITYRIQRIKNGK